MSAANIAKRVRGIKDEVNELHPLLDRIFSEMGHISGHTHTHGPNEMGADFILTRKDEDFPEPEHVGVVVKVGNINQGNKEIDHQIDECHVKRIVTNGQAKEIYLSEVWVVTNGKVSENLKIKLLEKYKASNLKFVEAGTLIEWTRKYVPFFGMELEIDEGSYLKSEIQASLEREKNSSLLPANVERFYIDQEIIEHEETNYKNKTQKKSPKGNKKVDFIAEIEKRKTLFIEAGIGGGKTKLVNNMMQHFSSPEVFSDTKLLPRYYRFADLFDLDVSSEQSIIDGVDKASQIKSNLKRGYLLFFDGLDEIKINDSHEEHIQNFSETVRNSNRLKVVITSRTLKQGTIETELFPFADRYEIKPLSTNSIIKFIEKVCVEFNSQGRLIEDLKETALFNSLPRTPIAAIILSRIISERGENLPSNLTELYEQYSELALGRWDDHKGLEHLKSYEAQEAILAEMAEYLLDNELPEIALNEAQDIFEKYLGNRNFEVNPSELLGQLLERSELLVEDERKKTVSFKHKSFAEFFYAKKLFTKPEVELSATVFEPYWMNCYFFLAGMKKDCPAMIESLIKMELDDEAYRLLRIMSLGNIMLAAYTTPYDVITVGVRSMFRECADLFLEINSGKMDSPLTQFPTMKLLAIFRFLTKKEFSYDFFKKAVLDTIEELGTSPQKSERTAYELFLLDLVRVDVDGPEVFLDLIEAYGSELPTPIQLGIRHESGPYQSAPTPIKKLEKRIRKSMGSSQSFNQAITNLYNKPIK